MNKKLIWGIVLVAVVIIGYIALSRSHSQDEIKTELVSTYPMLQDSAYTKTPYQVPGQKISACDGMESLYYKKTYTKDSGWNNIVVIDCGSIYYIYHESDSNPGIYGPFRASAEAVSTSNWKTFINPMNDFSIQHPANVHISQVQTEERDSYLFNLDENRKLMVDITKQTKCSLRAYGTDPMTVKINGIDFQSLYIAKELSLGTDGYFGVGTEYCTVRGVAYKITPQIRYKAGTTAPHIDEDIELKTMVESFRFINPSAPNNPAAY